jgi:hypothetical protein
MPSKLIRTWPQLRKFYAGLARDRAALAGMLSLVSQIEESRYAAGIFGWTSHADLQVTQYANAVHGDRHPYLRISVLPSTMLEFRYMDTLVPNLQWRRSVREEQGFQQLERFFRQLHWFNEVVKR